LHRHYVPRNEPARTELSEEILQNIRREFSATRIRLGGLAAVPAARIPAGQARFSALTLDLLFLPSEVMDVIVPQRRCTGPTDASPFRHHMVDLDEPKRPTIFATALEVPLTLSQ
jgi:hypothetical protein